MNYMLIVLESMRFDLFKKAYTPHMDRVGEAVKAYSAADWTLPSVTSMMTGLLPHSEYGQPLRDMVKKKHLLKEGIWMPSVFRKMGYNTEAHVSIPWLNKINKGWDLFEMHDSYNNIFSVDRKLEPPYFCYIHVGDTHMPYGGKPMTKEMLDRYNAGKDIINDKQMNEHKNNQMRVLEYVDGHIGRLRMATDKPTKIIITSDHGELFGEKHLFGHGVGFHKKVFEVPMIIGETE